jgi:hypothetical protein
VIQEGQEDGLIFKNGMGSTPAEDDDDDDDGGGGIIKSLT